jgi:two-component system nitrate/nitrite response regulator NarP
MNADPLTVHIIDDHSLIVDLVNTYLSESGDFVVSVSSNFSDGISMIHESDHLDVVLLDVDLPGLTGINDVKRVVEVSGDGAVALFSGSVSATFVEKALQCGARGFIPKTLPLRALTSAIRLIAAGQVFVPSNITFGDALGIAETDSRLNQVEKTILVCLAEGQVNKEIAFQMQMSESTVKMHVRTICRKLGARNRTHAVTLGRANGLL